jgi:predicted metal-dependent peptidase
MSGSIRQEDAATFLSEVKGILDQYNDYSIHLWCFDTQVHNPVKITHDEEDEFFNYKLIGAGGTSFEVNWEFMKEEDINPKKFIMFTDGYPCGSWGDPDYCDTLFILKGNYDENAKAPFGDTVRYESING